MKTRNKAFDRTPKRKRHNVRVCPSCECGESVSCPIDICCIEVRTHKSNSWFIANSHNRCVDISDKSLS